MKIMKPPICKKTNLIKTSKVVGVRAKAKMQNILSKSPLRRLSKSNLVVGLFRPQTSWVQPQKF